MFSLALVTGASSGIGWALSHLLAEKQIPLILSGRDAARLEELKRELSAKVPVTLVIADLLSPKGRAELVKMIHTRSPDLVINNAGFGLYGDALTYGTQEQLDILTINANVVLELTLEAARTLISSGKNGVILNVASAAAFETIPAFSVYSAAKSCVVKFSEALDFEVAPQGVRILTACPGMVETDFRRRASSGYPQTEKGMTPQYAAEQIWRQIHSGKRVAIFNSFYKVALWFSNNFLPKSWVAPFLHSRIKSRIKDRKNLL